MQEHIHKLERIKDPVYRYHCLTCGRNLKIMSGILVTKDETEAPRMWIEKLRGQDSVRSVTVVGKNAVYYGVEVNDVAASEWVEVWQSVVEFASDKTHRPGGNAFVQAANEQERQLYEAVKLVPAS